MKALTWGIILLAAAALCGFLNIAGAYADNGKAAMWILAAILLGISVVIFYNAGKRTTPQHQPAAAPEQQHQPPPPQPPPGLTQTQSGLFIPRSEDTNE